MGVEQKEGFQPFRQASTLSIPNVINAFLDSPIARTRISIGTLAEDGRTVMTKRGTVQVDRAEARPGQKVVVYEI